MIDEFIQRLGQIHGVFINMHLSYMLLENKMNELMPDNSNTIHFGDGNPNDPNTSAKLSVNIGEFKSRISKDGHDTKLLSNLCLVALYHLWEDEYREKIAKTKGLSKNDLSIDIFGDIRILRRAIIHNKSNRFDEFDKIKILDFIKQRDLVYLTNLEFGLIIDKIRSELNKLG